MSFAAERMGFSPEDQQGTSKSPEKGPAALDPEVQQRFERSAAKFEELMTTAVNGLEFTDPRSAATMKSYAREKLLCTGVAMGEFKVKNPNGSEDIKLQEEVYNGLGVIEHAMRTGMKPEEISDVRLGILQNIVAEQRSKSIPGADSPKENPKFREAMKIAANYNEATLAELARKGTLGTTEAVSFAVPDGSFRNNDWNLRLKSYEGSSAVSKKM